MDAPAPPDAPARPLREGVDYTVDAAGRLTFTASYLRSRGACCGNGCRHCPYGWENVPADRRPAGSPASDGTAPHEARP